MDQVDSTEGPPFPHPVLSGGNGNHILRIACLPLTKAGEAAIWFIVVIADNLSHSYHAFRAFRPVQIGLIARSCVSSGVDAILLLLIVGYLMGGILAHLAAEQLRPFGAHIYIGRLVGVTLAREVGPLMAGVVVAGRSATDFAAQIGSMKVNHELRALQFMGLDPYNMLVFPRLVACVLVLPILALITDFVGILGAMYAGVGTLHFSWVGYLRESLDAVQGTDLLLGSIKSIGYGAIIALVGTQRGFQVDPESLPIGRAARSAVVRAIVLIVMFDRILTSIWEWA